MKVTTKPVTQRFILKSDPEPREELKAAVTVRQATTGDNQRRATLFQEQTRIWDDGAVGQVQLKQKWNPLEQKRLEAFLTLGGAENLKDEEDNDLFRFREKTKIGTVLAMSESDFNVVWDSLPPDVSKEIHGYILQANPQWDPTSGE